MATGEIVIVAAPGTDVATVLDPAVLIRHQVSSRVAIVIGDESSMLDLAGRSDVVAVLTDADDDPDLTSLDPVEALFIDGWRLRLSQPIKDRVGDGAEWDDGDHRPPDPDPR